MVVLEVFTKIWEPFKVRDAPPKVWASTVAAPKVRSTQPFEKKLSVLRIAVGLTPPSGVDHQSVRVVQLLDSSACRYQSAAREPVVDASRRADVRIGIKRFIRFGSL